MSNSESPSLEYIEDPYIPKLENVITPSLDLITQNSIEAEKTAIKPYNCKASFNSVDATNTTYYSSVDWNKNHDDKNDDYYEHYDDNDNDQNDDVDDGTVTETDIYLRHLTLDDIFYDIDDSDYTNQLELQTVETEFIADKLSNQMPSMSIAKRYRLKFFTKHRMRDVKVTFIDFSKPYFAKISSSDNYKRFLNIGSSTNNNSLDKNSNNENQNNSSNKQNKNNNNNNNNKTTKDNINKHSGASSPVASIASADIADELAGFTEEEVERVRAEWSQELARLEEEIHTLRTVLASKTRHASDLKRKLGITVWKEITDDMNQGLKSVKESSIYQSVEQNVGNLTKAVYDAPIFQRTESALKSTGEKTASVFGSITSGISSKFTQMKTSESMRSIEEKMGIAYENVKTKVTNSRSGSVSSFNDNNTSGLNSPTSSMDK